MQKSKLGRNTVKQWSSSLLPMPPEKKIVNNNKVNFAQCGGSTNLQFDEKPHISPANPREKTFAESVTILKNHFNPKPRGIVQRFGFISRTRRPTEFAAELRKLTHSLWLWRNTFTNVTGQTGVWNKWWLRPGKIPQHKRWSLPTRNVSAQRICGLKQELQYVL